MAHLRLSVVLALAACGAPPPPPPPPPPAPVAPPPGAFRGAPATVVAKRFPLRLDLPDGASWARAEPRSSFMVLEHTGSGSQVAVKLWHASELMQPARCEEAARLIREIPKADEGIERKRVAVPGGFDSRAELGVHEADADGIEGHVTVFGAEARRCFAFVFTTRAKGPNAAAVVAERLGTVVDVVLPSVGPR